jgi:S1-C subfamily serine protease
MSDTIPTDLQPKARDYPFDLDQALSAIVGVKAHIPEDGSTASGLGTERSGSGVVIDSAGLVLTIGYLIVEAEKIWLTTADGRALPGHALAYDAETGFGLIQALGRLGLPALALGDSTAIAPEEALILAAFGGKRQAIKARLAFRQHFAAYWEYLLDDALYTAPLHPNWGGAGLIDSAGRLVGIGSLALQQPGTDSGVSSLNLVVPTDLLKPILGALRRGGRTDRAPRPWLGVYAGEQEDAVIIHGLAGGGPAEQAGLRLGDRILAIGDASVGDLRTLWRSLWATGTAGVDVRLQIGRGNAVLDITVTSGDRIRFLRSPSLQ